MKSNKSNKKHWNFSFTKVATVVGASAALLTVFVGQDGLWILLNINPIEPDSPKKGKIKLDNGHIKNVNQIRNGSKSKSQGGNVNISPQEKENTNQEKSDTNMSETSPIRSSLIRSSSKALVTRPEISPHQEVNPSDGESDCKGLITEHSPAPPQQEAVSASPVEGNLALGLRATPPEPPAPRKTVSAPEPASPAPVHSIASSTPEPASPAPVPPASKE